MSNYLTDLFADSSGTSLSGHTPNSGGAAWAVPTGSFAVDGSGGVYGSSSSSSWAWTSITGGQTTYDITFEATPVSATSELDLAFCGSSTSASDTTGNAYFVQFIYGNINTAKNGALANIVTGGTIPTYTAGVVYTFLIQVRATTITVYINGVLMATVTDSTIARSALIGFRSTTNGSTSGFHIQNLQVNSPAIAAFVDNLTGSAGTIAGHTPNSGGSAWAVPLGGVNLDGSGKLYGTSTSNWALSSVSGNPSAYDFISYYTPNASGTYEIDPVVCASSTGATDTSGSSYFIQFCYGTIVSLVNGVFTTIFTGGLPTTFASGVTYKLTVRVTSTTIAYYINDTLVGSATDSSISRSGIVGYRIEGNQTSTGGRFGALTVTTAAPPSYTLTGPASGLVGSASNNFTVAYSGTLASSVVITPAATGLTFTPSSVTLAAGTNPSGTFVANSASAGAYSISTTNSGSLTNPSPVSYSVYAISVSNTNLSYSPANIYSDGGTMQSNNVRANSSFAQFLHIGAYLEFYFTGTSLTLGLSTLQNPYDSGVVARVIIDSGLKVDTTLALQSTQNYSVSGLANTTHRCQLYNASQNNNAHRFDGTTGFQLIGINADGGATISAPTYDTSDVTVLFTDSYGEYGPPDQGDTGGDNIANIWRYVGQSNGGQYGIVGYSGSGYLTSNNAGTPTVLTFIPYMYNTVPRTALNVKRVCICLGTNDGPSANITTTVTAAITAARAFASLALIEVFTPVNQTRAAQIIAGVAAYTADTNVKVIDIPSLNKGFGNGASYNSADGTHMTEMYGAVTAARYIQAATIAQSGGGGGGGNGNSITPFLK